MLDKYGLFAEFVAPRLWFDKRTNDGGFTASRKEDREFAQWRARRSCDIAKALGTNKIQLWLAREGTLCAEGKNPVEMTLQLRDAFNDILTYRDDALILCLSRSPMSPSTAPSAALPATHWLSALTPSIRAVSACASNPRTPSSPASIPPTTWASRWLSTSCGASI